MTTETDKAADRKSRGFLIQLFLGVVSKTNSLAGWSHVSLHRFPQPFLVLAACGTSAALSIWSLSNNSAPFRKASTRVRGRGLCVLMGTACNYFRLLLVLESGVRAPKPTYGP
jgi:hypothetical protein